MMLNEPEWKSGISGNSTSANHKLDSQEIPSKKTKKLKITEKRIAFMKRIVTNLIYVELLRCSQRTGVGGADESQPPPSYGGGEMTYQTSVPSSISSKRWPIS
jgi:hypothetical protein